MAARMQGLLPLPSSSAALTAELERVERELSRTPAGPGYRLLAIERRRVVLALDARQP